MTRTDGHCNKSGGVVADFEVPIPTDLTGTVITFCTYIREGYRVIILTGPAVLSNNGTLLGQTTTKSLQASHSFTTIICPRPWSTLCNPERIFFPQKYFPDIRQKWLKKWQKLVATRAPAMAWSDDLSNKSSTVTAWPKLLGWKGSVHQSGVTNT